MRTHHHFGLNVQVQLLLMTIFFFLLPNAAPYLSLIFDSLLDLGEFRGKSTYIQHPGTAEPFRIAPAEPVAYTNSVKALSKIFRAKFQDQIEQAGLLGKVPPKVWTVDWNVNCQAVGTAEATLNYLAPY